MVIKDSKTIPSLFLVQLYGPMQPPDAEPLAIELVASAVLEKFPDASVEYRTLDTREGGKGISRVVDAIAAQAPIMVGISIPQSTYVLGMELIRSVIQAVPGINIVLGHALPTYSPDLFLRAFPNIVVVRGWGEESCAQLLECHINGSSEFTEIPNLCFMKQNELFFTKVKWPAKIRKPTRFEPNRFFPRVESSRGCHHDRCTFCTRQPRNGKFNEVWQRGNVADILEDVADLKSRGVKFFTFADEDFIGNDLSSAMQIAEGLSEIGGMQFSLSVRADNVFNPQGSFAENELRKRLFELLRQAGLYLVFIGVESLSDSQLRRYGKGITAADSIRATRSIQRLGADLEVGFILFDPLLSLDELNENINQLDASGLWANVGQLYNPIRPQKASKYKQLLVVSELIGEYHPNSMAYKYNYSDSEVGEIARFCRRWLDDFDPAYLLARNIERTSESSGAYARFVLGVRSHLFRFLRIIVQSPSSRDRLADSNKNVFFAEERLGLLRNLHRHLESKSDLTATEIALKEECELFINRELNF